MKNYQINGWKRINKTKARMLFEQGKTIVATPCKMIFGIDWKEGFLLKKDLYEESFDLLVKIFESVNCNDNTGRYCMFYAISAEL